MDPQRLLGSLLSGAMHRRLPPQAAMTIGMGAIGLAVAAWEHFSEQRAQAAQPAAPPPLPPPLPGAGPSPLPSNPPLARPMQPLPGEWPTPPPLSAVESPAERAEREAILLVRAMVVAAWADGVIDPQERGAIQDRLATSGLSTAEQEFFRGELDTPPPEEALLTGVDSPALAEQVYLVSLLATRADTAAERAYLQRLQGRLALDPQTIRRLHLLVGVPA